ncbi:MAG: DUF4097 family beta strand repeat-containing protein [Terriglobia bacterium]
MLGLVILLRNFVPQFRPFRWILRHWQSFWFYFAEYWPVILILWGLYKTLLLLGSLRRSFRRRKSLLSTGEIVLFLFLVIFGTAVSTVAKVLSHGNWPWTGEGIQVSVEDDDGDLSDDESKFEFEEESSRPVQIEKNTPLSLTINNRNGGVEVYPHDQPEIKVRLKKIIAAGEEADAKRIASELKMVWEQSPSEFVLSSSRDSMGQGSRKGLRTNFTVWVPKSLHLTINNSHGPVTVQGFSGTLQATTSYGPVVIKEVEGDLQLENKFAPVTVTNLSGSCQVSGKYGSIELSQIGGKVEVENAYGAITLSKIKGPVSVSNRYNDIVCGELDSSLSIEARHAGVEVNNVKGEMRITTSYKNIKVVDGSGSIQIQNKHGDIEIRNHQPLIQPVMVEAEYSGVELVLPKESGFEVDATAKYGKVVSDFAGTPIQVKESKDGPVSRYRASYGAGGPTLTIMTSYHDIHLSPS